MKPTILVAAIALAVYVTSAGADAANGWNHKALNDERQASAIVEGFSKSGARLYHDGLVYVHRNGIRIGSKTISDVVELGRHHRDAFARSDTVTTNAASKAPTGGIPSLLTALSLLFGLFLFIVARKRRPISVAEPIQPGPSEYDLARTCAIVPISVSGVMLHKGETFYLEARGADAIAEHHHAEYVGGYAGVSMRVARGLSVHTGSSRGKREDRVTLDVDDSGTLYLSNQRVLFVGGRKTVDIPFSRFVGVEAFADGLKVNRSNAKPLVLRTGSQREAVILRRIVSNDLQPPRPVQPIAIPEPVPTDTQPHDEPEPSGETAPLPS